MEEGELKLIFLESSLERVPEEISRHPSVVRLGQRTSTPPRKMLLDKAYHYPAMAKLPEKWKRGRPDILHLSLLVSADTDLYERGVLKIYFQAYSGEVYFVRPGVRIPVHLDRFKGLMGQLLENGMVPPGSSDPLIYRVSGGLRELLGDSKLILLSEEGEYKRPLEVVREAVSEGAYIGIGAFPQGAFREETSGLAWRTYSIARGRTMKAWGVAARIVCACEAYFHGG